MLYLLALIVLAGILAWLFWGGHGTAATRRRASDDIDYGELEEAEREVREAADEDDVRNWGPGAPRPPHGG